MRIDRLFSIYIANLFGCFIPDNNRFSILMYHSISDKPDKFSSPYYQVVTTPDKFQKQMEFLKVNGFKCVTLESILKKGVDNKTVVLTFDDGFHDFYKNAWPVLKYYNFSATVFLPTKYISDPEELLSGHAHLNWKQVNELHDNGIEFGSHTVTHSKLYGFSQDAVIRELIESKKEIEKNVSAPVESFSYPYAIPDHDSSFISFLKGAVHDAGYKLMVSTHVGRNRIPVQSNKFLYRLPINNADDDRLFSAKLKGRYDWLGLVQMLYKKIKYFRK